MGKSRKIVERQIQTVQEALDSRLSFLTSKNFSTTQIKNDPIKRKLEGRIRKGNLRLKAIDDIDKCNAQLAQVKAERLAAPKVAKGKKDKKEAAPAKAEKAQKKQSKKKES